MTNNSNSSKQVDLKSVNDLEYIIKYQETNKDYYANILYKKYHSLICKYAHKSYKYLSIIENTGFCELEDLIQDYSLYFFDLISKVNKEKIKKGVTYNFIGMIYLYFKAYKVVIENKYRAVAYNYIESDTDAWDAWDENQISYTLYNSNTDFTKIIELEDVISKFTESLKETKTIQKQWLELTKYARDNSIAKEGIKLYKVMKNYYKIRNDLKIKFCEYANISI